MNDVFFAHRGALGKGLESELLKKERKGFLFFKGREKKWELKHEKEGEEDTAGLHQIRPLCRHS